MPLYRRLPKKGFTNASFQLSYHVVNVGELETAFGPGGRVDLAAIQELGLAPKKARYLKILGFGELAKALKVSCHAVSGGARQKIEGAKGAVELLPVRAEHREKGVKSGAAGGVATPSGKGGARS